MAVKHDLAGLLAVGMGLLPACAQDAFEDSDPERIVVGVTLVQQGAGFELQIDPDVPVHWVEVSECEVVDGDCTPYISSQYRYFDSSTLIWETSMASEEGSFGPAMTGEPKIAGPIIYGQLPDNAGFQSVATPLREGGRYVVNVYQTAACSDSTLDCLSTEAAGGLFFEIVGGELNELEPEVVE